jgi:predicted aminopeptidase
MLTRTLAAALIGVVASAPLGGCALGYYWQATAGHLELMRQRRPVADIVGDATTAETVRAKLDTAGAALAFAHDELQLPDNGSYRLYADTGRPYVVWNVVAAPEFSLEPRTWCFPVAGCISYRGYFEEADARRFAARLERDGDDVIVAGVAAYSTLGRFEDPLLNTMIAYSDYALAGLIFHELAHQRLYVKDDSTFNESFASFVEQQGLRAWLVSRGADEQLCRYGLSLSRKAEVQAMMATAREQLEEVYARDVPDADLRAEKAAVFTAMMDAYRALRAGWSGPPHFDHWFDGAFNNARLASFATYDEYVPAFAALMQEAGNDFESFYERADALADLGKEEREKRMRALLTRSAPPAGAPTGCDANVSAATGPAVRGAGPGSAGPDPWRAR